ncbi:MAG: S-layer homology domain-containing protein [Clostridiales bacterium]|nr:S-layer homology domain-containing protein [Clostridiales bacterium]
MYKKITISLSIIILICVLFTISAFASFTDESVIVNKEAVIYLTENGIINGFKDGTFRAANNVTRAEFAKMVFIMERDTSDAGSYVNQAPELSDIHGHWANGYISALYKEGVIAGKSNNRFDPDGLVTGFEMAKMLLVATGTDAKTAGLTDAGWMIKTESLARDEGMLTNYTVALSDPATRDHAALMIYNAMTNGENSASSYKLCAVTAVQNNQVNILDQDGRKASYSSLDISMAPTSGDIYYYKEDQGKLILKKLNRVRAKNTMRTSGIQTYWSGDKIVTIDGEPYQTDADTVIFIKNNREGLPGKYTYDFRVYKAQSLKTTYAGSVVSDAILETNNGKTVARLIVCDMDTYDVSKRSATGIAYVTDDSIVSVTDLKQVLVSYPMFAGHEKELYMVYDSEPGSFPSLKGQFVTYEINSQGRLKTTPTATPVTGLSLTHAQNTFVLGEIMGYDSSVQKVQIDASGDSRIFAFAEDYKIVYLDTKNQQGADNGTIAKGNGKTNCVYYANASNQIVTLFIDVNGQIQ